MARLTVIPGGRAEAERLDPPAPSAAGAAACGPGRLEELYRRHAPGVFGRCRYLLQETEAARDATQEVFARALRALPEFQGAASPTTWLLRIATHHCLNVLRARRAA